MADVTRTDPLRNFKFRVTVLDLPGIRGLATMGFASVSGISIQNEMIPYREGGWNTSPHKMVGQSDVAPVSFNRGLLALNDQLYKWQQLVYVYQWGTGELTDPRAYRTNIKVEVFDHPVTKGVSETSPGNPRFAYLMHNCWPGSFAVNDLNASDNGILIQQLTVHTEGIEPLWPS